MKELAKLEEYRSSLGDLYNELERLQQKETPLGVGEIIDVFTREDKTISECKACIKTHSVWFSVDNLKHYKTPHEKLLDMGFEEKIHDKTVEREIKRGDYKQYVNYPFVILIDLNRKEFTTYTLYNGSKNNADDVSWVSLELSRILTQYLEEMV